MEAVHKFRVGDVVSNGYSNYEVALLFSSGGYPAVRYASGDFDYESSLTLVSRPPSATAPLAEGDNVRVIAARIAARIALTWNCHDELVVALSSIISEQDSMGFDGSPSNDLIDQARAALSRATSREGNAK